MPWRVSNPGLGIDQQVRPQSLEINRAIAQEIIFRNIVDDLVRGRGRDPLQGLVERIHQRLDRVRVGGDELPLGVEHSRRVGAAEYLIVHARKAGVRDDADDPVLLQAGDDRIEIRNRVDLPALHRVDSAQPAADPDECRIRRTESGLGHEVQDKEMGGRPRRRHPDLHALEIGVGTEWRVLADGQNDARKAAELDERADVLALGLRAQRVLISAGHDIDRPREQGIERLGAAFEVGDRHVQPVVLEVTTALRQRDRQVIEMRLVGDAEPDRRAFELLRSGEPRHDRRQREAAQTGGKGAAIDLHAGAARLGRRKGA